MSDTYFEVQRLVTEGDNAGHWENARREGAAEMGRAAAIAFRAKLLATLPNTAFRVVPFGTGPNGRPGDVNPEGAIIMPPGSGRRKLTAGRVLVTPEQAENAALFGWEWTGQANGGSARQTAVEIWRNEIVPSAEGRSYEGLTSLDEWLEEEGIAEEVTAKARARVDALKANDPDPDVTAGGGC